MVSIEYSPIKFSSMRKFGGANLEDINEIFYLSEFGKHEGQIISDRQQIQ